MIFKICYGFQLIYNYTSCMTSTVAHLTVCTHHVITFEITQLLSTKKLSADSYFYHYDRP